MLMNGGWKWKKKNEIKILQRENIQANGEDSS